MTYCPFFRNTTETQDMDFANGLPQILGGLFIYLFIYVQQPLGSDEVIVDYALLFVMEMMV
jgi:ABC-type tungstate transport system substrate-binding protein